jgi:hypothetical protein
VRFNLADALVVELPFQVGSEITDNQVSLQRVCEVHV